MDIPPALISCDEAGFTGPKLLDDNQPIFAYAAIDVSAEEADAIAKAIKTKYRVQAPELEAAAQARQLAGHRLRHRAEHLGPGYCDCR